MACDISCWRGKFSLSSGEVVEPIGCFDTVTSAARVTSPFIVVVCIALSLVVSQFSVCRQSVFTHLRFCKKGIGSSKDSTRHLVKYYFDIGAGVLLELL